MYQNNEFPFDMEDLIYLLRLHVRHKNSGSLDVDCPFCGDKKGKMNLNLKKRVFRCNRCGEYGGMLALYGKLHGLNNQDAYEEIKNLLGKNQMAPEYIVHRKEVVEKKDEPEVRPAPDEECHKTFSRLLSMLILSKTHEEKLLKRGFSIEQIERYGYKSTPAFGFKGLVKKLLDDGCVLEGVPGFYQDENDIWCLNVHAKASGIMIPVRNIDGLILGMQIRMDRPMTGMKYMWLSSIGRKNGITSGSPIHFVGNSCDKVVFMTEGPLKADLSNALSGRTFGAVPGANQYKNLPYFLKRLREEGAEMIYDAYDMDKFLNTLCRRDYNEECSSCEIFRTGYSKETCSKKVIKRNNIKRGCKRLKEVCNELELKHKMLTWNMAADGTWKENEKGIDDYLVSIRDKSEISI